MNSFHYKSAIALLSTTLFLIVLASASCVNRTVSNNANVFSPTPSTFPTETPKLTPTASPTPTGPNNILFIVDSSGSMKTKIGGKAKIEIAKKVVTDLVGELPPDVQAGLMAYGHRDKDNCEDIELLVPVGPVDKSVFSQKVNSLNPLGQTPISSSIRQASEVLRGKPGNRTIILISDGEETCKQDPCAVAAELKKADVDLKVHVVGFGIESDVAKKQLHCIAEATGGIYKDAADAAGLKKTLEALAKGDEQKGDLGQLVANSLDSHGKLFRWCVTVTRVDGGERVYEGCVKDDAAENRWDLPPGIYNLQFYRSTDITWYKTQNIEIKAGQDTQVDIPQAGRLIVKSNVEGAVVQAVSRTPNIQTITFNSNKSQEVLPGIYDLETWGGLSEKRNGIEIMSGKETVVEINGGQ